MHRATLLLVIASAAGAVDYYVDPAGDDASDGRSPATAWASLARVNAAEPAPGDRVLFARGGRWRGQLIPRSGDETGVITYAAYGQGPKPTILGSVAMDDPADWQPAGPGLWTTVGPRPSDRAVLDSTSLPRLRLYCEGGAQGRGDLTNAGYQVRCDAVGEVRSHVQLILSPFAIRAGVTYELRARLSCDQPCELAPPALMKAGPPYSSYVLGGSPAPWAVTAQQAEYRVRFAAAVDADDARLTFFLGAALPVGATLTVADLRLVECDGADPLPVDVGNILFEGGTVCGVKRWDREAVGGDLTFWYDKTAHTVLLRSDRNPAERFASVELALDRHIINQSGRHHVTYENLCLLYGGAHGIGGGTTHHITVRDCDIGWIGGGELGTRVRFGNGVEFWAGAHDCLVERCRLWEIYDAALTNQNQGSTVRQERIVYRRNVIWNCEYSFEYWNRPAESVTRDIRFEHNTCWRAGYGWGHSQRPDPAGRHLCFYTNQADTQGLQILNNVFAEAADVAFDALWWPADRAADPTVLRLDGNLWWQPGGLLARFRDLNVPAGAFADYQRATGQDPRGLHADPRFVNPPLDLRLSNASPGLDAAVDTEPTPDFHGLEPWGPRPDIGAFEFKPVP